MRNKLLNKITLTAVLSALSIIAFMIENLFPPLFIPGARMGISNIFILFTIIVVGYQYGFIVMTVKVLIGSVFSGNVSAILYSLPAGIISCTVEILLVHFTSKISLVAISVVGAVVNSAVQNTVFCIITSTYEYFAYLPYLSLISIVSGLIVGFTTYLIIKKLPLKILADKQ